MTLSGLTFGIYPMSLAGTPFGVATGPEDDYEKIREALRDLRGEDKKLSSRLYLIYTKEWEEKMLSLAERYLDAGLLDDLVIGCGDWTSQENSMELAAWLDFIRKVIDRYGSRLSSLQITNEPNLSFMEGSKPYILQALTEGAATAKKEIRDRKLPLLLGFGSVPESPASVPHFWENLRKAGGSEFTASVDFVGHNFYVDVFEENPLTIDEIPASVERTLRELRKNMEAAGLSADVPIRITENGWPTGKNPLSGRDRLYEEQAKALEAVIRTVYSLRNELNISHYELFGLRDADSAVDDLFHQYGILRDDYTPKPAYSMFRSLIRELGA